MKNKIKDYISGIQEAKSQSNKNYSINYSSNEPSFNDSKKMYEYNQPTFNTYNTKACEDAQYQRAS